MHDWIQVEIRFILSKHTFEMMNELDIKRLERDLRSTMAYLDKPIYQHLIVNVLVWALIMGPVIFFINNYQKGGEMPWDNLPRSIFIFGIGGMIYTFVMQLFYRWQKGNLEKRLGRGDEK